MSTLQPIEPDYDALLANLRREGTPRRVHYFEHGIADNVKDFLVERFGLGDFDIGTPEGTWRRDLAVHRFLGHELFRVFPPGARVEVPMREGAWVEEGAGAIDSWEAFEAYPWPRAEDADFSVLEFFDRELPDDMRVFQVVDLWEVVRDMMGFETVCLKFFEDPALVDAVFDKVAEFDMAIARAACDFDCTGAFYMSDDLGYKTSLMLSPDQVRQTIMPRHEQMARIVRERGKLLLFHSCGQMYELLDEYIDRIGIDAKHSFEEAVLPVTEAKRLYGDRVALLGGFDVDFMARADEDALRAKTREILEICHPGGGYCFGSGNWVTEYIPPENYLAVLEEAQRFAG